MRPRRGPATGVATVAGAGDGELRAFLLKEAEASPLVVRDWIREVAESRSVDVGGAL